MLGVDRMGGAAESVEASTQLDRSAGGGVEGHRIHEGRHDREPRPRLAGRADRHEPESLISMSRESGPDQPRSTVMGCCPCSAALARASPLANIASSTRSAGRTTANQERIATRVIVRSLAESRVNSMASMPAGDRARPDAPTVARRPGQAPDRIGRAAHRQFLPCAHQLRRRRAALPGQGQLGIVRSRPSPPSLVISSNLASPALASGP